MIYIVDVTRTVYEFGKMLVEAEDPMSALTKAKSIVDDDETGYTVWDEELQERTEEECEVLRAYPSSADPYFMNMTIDGHDAVPVLQENGSYILE